MSRMALHWASVPFSDEVAGDEEECGLELVELFDEAFEEGCAFGVDEM